MQLGSYRIDIVNDGIVWLDGGAMFGVVPKPLWSRLIRPDEKNRIPLATNCLLLRGPGGTILIETGVGDHLSEKERKIFNFQPSRRRLLGGLADLGVEPGDVDMVIQTHLHFDHVGNLARPAGGGAFEPNFPNADIVVQRAEWGVASRPDERSAPSYYPKAFWEAVASTGRMRIIEGEQEVAPGVVATPMGGHTPGHQIVEIRQGGRRAFYLGDFIPQIKHVGLPYIMAFDLFPLVTLEHKKVFLPEAIENGWLLFFEHDHEVAAGRLVDRGGRPAVEAQEA